MNRTVNGGGASAFGDHGLEAKANGSPKGRDRASGETRRRTLAAPEFTAASAGERPEATGWLRRAVLIVVDRTAPGRLTLDGSGPMSSARGLHQRADHQGRAGQRLSAAAHQHPKRSLIGPCTAFMMVDSIARPIFDRRFLKWADPQKIRARGHTPSIGEAA